MSNEIHDIQIVIEGTGKRISATSIANTVTAKELLEAVADKFNVPANTGCVLIRKLTRKQLLPKQTLLAAGIQDHETLIVDFERTAGGSMEFYPDGKLKKLDVEPEELPYLAEILKEIRTLHSDVATLSAKVAHISAEISEIRDSTVIISGNNSELQAQRNSTGK
jgi:hypothetical protein